MEVEEADLVVEAEVEVLVDAEEVEVEEVVSVDAEVVAVLAEAAEEEDLVEEEVADLAVEEEVVDSEVEEVNENSIMIFMPNHDKSIFFCFNLTLYLTRFMDFNTNWRLTL